jgi:hypothetical protein
MEDALYYIGLGLFITFSLISRAGKTSAKKSKKRRSMPTEPQMENFPPIIPTYTYKESSDNQAPKTVIYNPKAGIETPAEAQSLETIFDEEEIYIREQKQKAKRAEKTQGSVKNNPKPAAHPTSPKSSQPQKTSQKSNNSANSADFDLREAVIYSEILKPKFEE